MDNSVSNLWFLLSINYLCIFLFIAETARGAQDQSAAVARQLAERTAEVASLRSELDRLRSDSGGEAAWLREQCDALQTRIQVHLSSYFCFIGRLVDALFLFNFAAFFAQYNLSPPLARHKQPQLHHAKKRTVTN